MNKRNILIAAAAAAAAAVEGVSELRVSAQAAAPLGPVLAVVSHPVKDYAAWRVIYDSAEPIRAKAGVTGAEVFHDPKDPNMMVIIHRFPTLEAMHSFLGDPALKIAMEKGGVMAAPTTVVGIAV